MKQGRSVRLTFDSGKRPKRKLLAGLSALVQVDRYLLTASDETAVLERLNPRSGGRGEALRFGNHASLTSGARYRKHFLDLGGLGVRDLCMEGEDLLILAGPTMKLDGPALVFRSPDVVRSRRNEVIFRKDLHLVVSLPFGDGADHPEGMALVSTDAAPRELMIVFEKTSGGRRLGPRTVDARVFSI